VLLEQVCDGWLVEQLDLRQDDLAEYLIVDVQGQY
jgi:hypothetical protein